MNRPLLVMLIASLLVSACAHQNSTNDKAADDLTAKIESDIRQKNGDSNFPAVPEPIPPREGKVVVEPMPLPKRENRYTVVYDTEKYQKRKALSRAVKFHNNKKEPNEPTLSSTLKPRETVSEKGEEDKNGIILTNEIKIKDDSYVVKFMIDNPAINKIENGHFWEYEVNGQRMITIISVLLKAFEKLRINQMR